MRNLRKACVVFMTGLFCWLPVLQPLSLYADTVVYDTPATGEAAHDGESSVEADEASTAVVPESDSQTVQEEGVEGAETSDQQSDSNGQAADGTAQREVASDAEEQGVAALSVETEPTDSAASDAGTDSVGPTEDKPNSWRYDNGTLRTDIEPGISLLAMDVPPEGVTAQGIDVSEWNGTIDWAKVKAASIDYAILRVGYGSSAVDDQFAQNVKGCQENDIPFGVYVYCYAWDAASARSEAKGTVTRLKNAGVDPTDLSLPVYYDMENQRKGTEIPSGVDGNNQYHDIQGGAPTFASMASSFASVLQDAGYDVGIYANLNWWTTYLTDPAFDQWDRWVAQYNTACSYQGEYSAWQYTASGSVPGINGAVDMNWWYEPFDCAIGWVRKGNKLYYVDPSTGKLFTGERYIGGKWYYLDPDDGGARATGFLELPAGKTVYYGSDGAMRYGEQYVGGKWYHFDGVTGAMSTGLTKLSGKTVLYAEDGHMLYGLQEVPGKGQRYFDGVTGAMLTSAWFQAGGKWYYAGSDGKPLTGERYIGGKWYYLDPDDGGARATGFLELPAGKTVYYGSDGAMRYGEQYVGGKWYHFDGVTGAMSTGLTKLSGKTVLYAEDGHMLYGLQEVPGKGQRYFDGVTGAMVVNGWVSMGDGTERWADGSGALSICSKVNQHGDRYVYASDGQLIVGWFKLGNLTFYADKSGKVLSGRQEIDGSVYWFDQAGVMQTGEQYINGSWYYFSPSDGKMMHGVVLLPQGKWVYYDIKTGKMLYGEQHLSYDENHIGWYYFDPVTGAMAHGDVYLASKHKWVHYDAVTGKMVYGLQRINGAWYYFDPVTGAMVHGMTWVPEWSKWQYFHIVTGRYATGGNWIDWKSPSNSAAYPTLSNITNLNVRVSLGEQIVQIRSGNSAVYTMICSTGLNDSTPHGTFRVTGRGYSFYNQNERMGARYYVQFLGDYLFHSVPIDSAGNYIVSEANKLGAPASHGCVRLTVSDAKWLYDSLPNGTPVYIG